MRSLSIAAVAILSMAQAGHATNLANRHRHMPMAGAVAGNGGHSRHVFYGVGSGGQSFRTTPTGGNAGGYTNRN